MLPGGVEERPRRQSRQPPTGTIGLAGRATVLVGLLLLAIWAITSPRHFWVMWAWFGLAIPFALFGALRIGLRDPAGAGRPVSVLWALSGFAMALLLVIWALSGAGPFWPVFPIAALLLFDLVLGWFVVEKRGRRLNRRALADRIEMLTRSRRQTVDAQAAELRRIERDLHDGAQARLVALSMSLGRAELRLSGEPEARELVLDAQRQAREAIAELRDLTRGISRRCWPSAAWRPLWPLWRRAITPRSRPATRSPAGCAWTRRSRAPPTSWRPRV